MRVWEKCKRHPKYQAKRKPRADCGLCWEMWEWSKDNPENHDSIGMEPVKDGYDGY